MFKCFLTLNTNFSAFTFVAILLVSSRCDAIQCKRKFKAPTALALFQTRNKAVNDIFPEITPIDRTCLYLQYIAITPK